MALWINLSDYHDNGSEFQNTAMDCSNTTKRRSGDMKDKKWNKKATLYRKYLEDKNCVENISSS